MAYPTNHNSLEIKTNSRALFAFVLLSTGASAGCNSAPKLPERPSEQQIAESRSRVPASQPLTIEEIGRLGFGSTLQEARSAGGIAHFTFAPKQDLPGNETYRRIYLLASRSIPAAFRSDPSLKRIRFAAVDEQQPKRRLVVFAIDRSASKSLDWARSVTADQVIDAATTEYLDPEMKVWAETK